MSQGPSGIYKDSQHSSSSIVITNVQRRPSPLKKMDRKSERIESNFHSWHLTSSLPVSSCSQCRRHKEMTRRNAFANVHPSRISCGLPKYDPNNLQPRQDHYIDSDGELYYDPPTPKYSPEG